ncbi:hypothetical protein [Rhodocista pekingensis]|uniref:Uncharacterized protein n=1 Tax=Rhodocista pekingensis TaxID=201185 RepID=A0ABW2L261_9PROT
MVSSVVIPLRRSVQPRTRSWANQELAEFYRVVEILNRAGLAVSIDSGWSDEGDPWLVFLRDDSSDVIAHFAKIDGRLVASNGATGDTIRGTDFRDLLNALVRMQPLVLPPSNPATAKLYLHPSVVLSAFVAAALMLLSDINPAEASEVPSGQVPKEGGPEGGGDAAADPEAVIRPASSPVAAGRAFDGPRQWETLRTSPKADSIFSQAQFAALTAVIGTAVMLLESAGDAAAFSEPETPFTHTGQFVQSEAQFLPTGWAVAGLAHDGRQKPILTEMAVASTASAETAPDGDRSLPMVSSSPFIVQESVGEDSRVGIDSVLVSNDTVVISHDLLEFGEISSAPHGKFLTVAPLDLAAAHSIVFLPQGGVIEVRIVPVLAEILPLAPGKAVEVQFDILLDTVATPADVAQLPPSPDLARGKEVSPLARDPATGDSGNPDDTAAGKVDHTPTAQNPDPAASSPPSPPSPSDSQPASPASATEEQPAKSASHPPEAPSSTLPGSADLPSFGKIILADGSSDYALTTGRETIVFTGGNVTLFNFQFGTDRLIIETSNLDPSSMGITWSDEGSLIMTFSDNSTLTFIGLAGWDNAGG